MISSWVGLPRAVLSGLRTSDWLSLEGEKQLTLAVRNRFCVLFLALILAAVCLRCGKPAQGAQTGTPQAIPVKVMTVVSQKVGDFTEYIATIKSRSSAVIQPQVDGQVTRIFVHSGESVVPGQPLLEIDPLKQAATVRSQEATRNSKVAALQLAKIDFERKEKLYEAGVIAKQEFDQSKSAYEAAQADAEASQASVHEQQEQLRYYTVKAPSAGVVGDIPVRIGDRVSSTTMLTTVDKRGDLEAYVEVPSEKSASVRVGMPVVLLDSSGAPVTRTQVTFISPRVDASTQLLLIKAAIPANEDNRYRNDQVVHAQVVWTERDLPTVPVTAVTRIGGQAFVLVAEEKDGSSVAHQKLVQLGEVAGPNYVVLGGLKPGDKLILNGTGFIADGMPVMPQQAQEQPVLATPALPQS
jgi:RND family efflux transporter MFP subunit